MRQQILISVDESILAIVWASSTWNRSILGYPILGCFRVRVLENLWKTSLSSFSLAWEFSSKLKVLETGVYSGTKFWGILGFKYPKIYEKRVWVVLGWPENFQVNSEHTFSTLEKRNKNVFAVDFWHSLHKLDIFPSLKYLVWNSENGQNGTIKFKLERNNYN